MTGPGISRRLLLGGAAAALAMPLRAEAPLHSIRPLPRPGSDAAKIAARISAPSAADLIAKAKLGGTVGFSIADARTGLGLEALAQDVALPPASVMKVLTSAYALEKLGKDHRFVTRVLATGPVQGGKLSGDLILAGGGDPTLDTDRLGDLAATLAAQGLRRVTGNFLVYAGALPEIDRIDGGQEEHIGYNPALSGLNLNFNRVHFEWRRNGSDYTVSMEARGERFTPKVPTATVRIIPREAPTFTYEGDGPTEAWTVARAALGKGGSRWLPVRRPALYAGDTFRALLQAQGVDLPAPQVVPTLPQAQLLSAIRSEPLPVVLRDMLKFSTNLTAEIVGLSASGQRTLAASAQAMRDWAGPALGLTSARLGDHSGLGPLSRISAAEMTRVLVRLQASGTMRPLLKHIPFQDAKGRDKSDHPIRVDAKTGTLNFVSALAGYATLPDGMEVAFTIFCADPERRDAIPLGDRESPPGGAAWVKRARGLQQHLVERWGVVYGT